MCAFLGENSDCLQIWVMRGAYNLKANLEATVAAIDELGEVALILVDTSTAYREDQDEDDNALSKQWAQALRWLLNLASSPTVIAATHPVKNATADNLLPRGGGSFLNEVDGNLTLWASGDDQLGAWTRTALHWQGKIRGLGFRSIVFEFFTHPHPTATFHDGSPVMLTLIMPAEKQPTAGPAQKRVRLSGHEETALQVLDCLFLDGKAEMAPVFDDGAEGLAVRERVWRQACYETALPGRDQDTKRRTFTRAIDGLLRKERIKCRGDHVWPAR
jgi:hypothetical protein